MSDLLASLKSEWELAQGGPLTRVPLYHQLYSVLRGAILDGTIAYDAQMPTEQQLAATFDVSRITAKRAMDDLDWLLVFGAKDRTSPTDISHSQCGRRWSVCWRTSSRWASTALSV
jgi:hypothetical protein